MIFGGAEYLSVTFGVKIFYFSNRALNGLGFSSFDSGVTFLEFDTERLKASTLVGSGFAY